MLQHRFSNKTAFIDSTTTNHYAQSSVSLTDLKPLINAQHIYLPNSDSIKSNQTGVLHNLPMLSTTARTTQICKNIDDMSLKSLEKLRD